MRLGRPEAARPALAAWDAMHHPEVGEQARRRRVDALFTRDPADLERVRDEFLRLLLPLDALWTTLDLAAALDRKSAIELLSEAAETASAMGSVSLQKLSEERLRAAELGIEAAHR